MLIYYFIVGTEALIITAKSQGRAAVVLERFRIYAPGYLHNVCQIIIQVYGDRSKLVSPGEYIYVYLDVVI